LGQGEIGTSIIQFWECKLLVGGVPKVSEFVLVMDQSMLFIAKKKRTQKKTLRCTAQLINRNNKYT
jgi:hypothetical protein